MFLNGLALLAGDAPELFGEGAVVVPAGFGDLEANRLVGAVSVVGEGVGGEDEVGTGVLGLQPLDERGHHAAADTAALVRGGHVHRPEVEPGAIVQVYGDAADGGVAFAGDEVAVGSGLAGAGQLSASAGGVAQMAEVEGVGGTAAFAPSRQLGEQSLVPGTQLKAVTRNREGIGGGAGRAHAGRQGYAYWQTGSDSGDREGRPRGRPSVRSHWLAARREAPRPPRTGPATPAWRRRACRCRHPSRRR